MVDDPLHGGGDGVEEAGDRGDEDQRRAQYPGEEVQALQ